MSQVDEFHYHTTPEYPATMVPYPTSKDDCPICKGHPYTYDGGKRWAVVQNLNLLHPKGTSDVVAMLSEREARQMHASWLEFAKDRLPDNPECWPVLVSADITWTETP